MNDEAVCCPVCLGAGTVDEARADGTTGHPTCVECLGWGIVHAPDRLHPFDPVQPDTRPHPQWSDAEQGALDQLIEALSALEPSLGIKSILNDNAWGGFEKFREAVRAPLEARIEAIKAAIWDAHIPVEYIGEVARAIEADEARRAALRDSVSPSPTKDGAEAGNG